MTSEQLNIDDLAFDRCEDEPIHIPESVQGYGYLFALEPESGAIRVVSENVSEIFSASIEELIGQDFYSFLQGEEYSEFLEITQKRASERQVRLPLRLKFKDKIIRENEVNDYFAVVYESQHYFVIELEPAAEFRETYSALHYLKLYAMSIAPKYEKSVSLEKMAQDIVETIRYVSGMERVVLYRFRDDKSGQVIAESKVDHVESYLHLYYPASDIPKQARELYTKNWVRLIPDVELEPSPLYPSVEASGREPLDMTYSIIRTISPIHRQYLRNQGLKASMSLSLVTHGHLWGIISCHCREPCYIPQNVRLECENLSQLFSWHLYAKEEEIRQDKRRRMDELVNDLVDGISVHNSILSIFKKQEKEALKIMNAEGFAFFYEDKSFQLGITPDDYIIEKLIAIEKDNGEEHFRSADISGFASNQDDLNGIRGALVISVAKEKGYYTAWFRKEHAYIQRWAGVPEEKDSLGSKKERLMPRSSFEIHEKEITDKSEEWDENDLIIAARLNKIFMAYVLDLQEDMRQDIDTLQVKDKNKNEFIATLAHELKNPLTPIRTGISILEHSDDPDIRKKTIHLMKRQTRSINKLIDDLLDVSRISEGKIHLEKQKIQLQEVLNEVIEVSEEMIRDKNHDLKIDFPVRPVFVDADLLRLSQVFINILNNAAKYTPAGGAIRIGISEEGQEARVSIADNGLGIPKEKQSQVFDMFNQMDSNPANTGGGLGIGLTLVKKLVSLHEGSIEVISEGPDKGSEFVVTLPLAKD